MDKEIKIRLEFERGGVLYGFIQPQKAPKTVNSIISAFPVEGTVMHTRWCGRELSFGINTKELPPKEETTCCVSKFDITYWRPWDKKEKAPEAQSFESIAFYYGAEHLAYHDGLLNSVIIGHIDYEQEDLLVEIGERIWKHGIETVKATII